MTLTYAIKNGFSIVNKNWQLVLIQIGAMFAGFIGFFIIVGIPLAIAFIIFGLDLTGLSHFKDALNILKEPTKIISKYFGLIVLVLTSFFLYLIMVLVLGVFVFGGSIGVISRSIKDETESFHIKTFLSEGKRLFFPLIWFTTLIGLIFIILAFILGLFGGAISAVVTLAKEQAAALALFLGIFFSLILFVIGFTFILAVLALTIYGSAIMAIKGLRPVRSLREAVYYLYKHPHAFCLYCMVFIGYLVISLIIMFLGYPMRYLPLIGSLMALVYQFMVYVAQSYLGFVTVATIFYYYSATEKLIDTSGLPAALDPGTTSEGSIQDRDTSGSQAPSQEDVPPEKSQSEQV